MMILERSEMIDPKASLKNIRSGRRRAFAQGLRACAATFLLWMPRHRRLNLRSSFDFDFESLIIIIF
ncbi:hypothetical protein OIU77_002580 [Salix suchowensis]|uniref:Uncharacterized protein n=1 Tax=Salix suchowensis TaxID=1278906 RepID=A0ABQ9AYH0_9ROSI|nr:hypothetical protein OIU77_002580 [Salix suchowensis]